MLSQMLSIGRDVSLQPYRPCWPRRPCRPCRPCIGWSQLWRFSTFPSQGLSLLPITSRFRTTSTSTTRARRWSWAKRLRRWPPSTAACWTTTTPPRRLVQLKHDETVTAGSRARLTFLSPLAATHSAIGPPYRDCCIGQLARHGLLHKGWASADWDWLFLKGWYLI